jgi:hypothetical protein
MMALHQHLELGLNIGALRVGFKAEYLEGAPLGVKHLAGLTGRLGPAGLGRPVEQPERIVGRPTGTAPAAGGPLGLATFSADGAHLPSRPVPGKVFFLIFRDRVVAHTLKKIVRIVVFADVIEAKPPIFRRVQPALRRTVGGRRVASRPFAGRKLGALPAILIGFYPDTIEEGRVITHRYNYAGACMAPSRLDRRQKCTWFAIDRARMCWLSHLSCIPTI